VGEWHEIKPTTVEIDRGDEVGFAAESAGGVPLSIEKTRDRVRVVINSLLLSGETT